MLKFSGHDTFHCKEQWLLKGIQLVDKEGGTEIFRQSDAIAQLGVGKNMVRSIYHWLKSFNIIDNNDELTSFATNIICEFDPYLENEGSLWLLQYHLCNTNYASIFKLVFADYFMDKAQMDFSEEQILKYLQRKIEDQNERAVSPNTLKSDYKVFIKSYVAPVLNVKTIEDDFNSPLLILNLIHEVNRKNSLNQQVYRVDRKIRKNISSEIFLYCVLHEFPQESSIDFERLNNTIGAYLCLSKEGLEELLQKTCSDSKYRRKVSFKTDAGIKQFQLKESSDSFKEILLKNHYA